MITTIYSILHMFVDGICAFAMFGRFSGNFLIYNFCAFALQMPFGAMLDYFNREKYNKICASLGVIFTLLGMWVHPAVLGVGNALFHVGAGVDVIQEDKKNGWNGQALGIFVAPGAWGLFLGAQIIGGATGSLQIFLTCIIIMLIFFTKPGRSKVFAEGTNSSKISLLVACFFVVILRSYVGMAVTFSWKTTTIAATIAVVAVVLGKMVGGILAARIGTKRTIVGSLLLAAVSYGLSSNMIMGIMALFFFNMTMPITLYLLVKRWKELPGFSFGLLTFGLFLGFLPVYYGVQLPVSGQVIGVVGSVASLVILLAGKGRCEG